MIGGEGPSSSFPVETVREIRSSAYILPNEAEYKVVILSGADETSTGAQNALLKILEEPPPHLLFILTCENRFKLLPTIQSRVVGVALGAVDADTATGAIMRILPRTGEEDARRAAEAFERRYPHIDVVTSTAGGQMDEQKLMTAIAGGSPPDVINQDRFSVGGWAARGAFLPLDGFLARDTTTIRAEDYYPACWNEAIYRGRVYAIPNTTDDRLLFYNEDLLRREGFVDAAGRVVPPRTWSELKQYAVKMTRRDARGNLTQVGFVPNYGNSWLYLYGWQNGGRFLSEDKTSLLNEPAIVAALVGDRCLTPWRPPSICRHFPGRLDRSSPARWR